jgi:hypothetical protein
VSAREQFEYDIFFSYASQTVGTSVSLLSNWSSQFKLALQSWIDSDLTSGPNGKQNAIRVKFDRDTDEAGRIMTGDLNPRLAQAIEESALMVVLMSPAYLDSEVCRYEAKAWAERKAKVGGDLTGRLVILEVRPTPDLEWPPHLLNKDGRRLVSAPLYAPGTDTPPGWGTIWIKDGQIDVPDGLNENLTRLSGAVRGALTRLEADLVRQQAETEQINRLSSGLPKNLYLYGRADYRADWKKMCDELDESGVVVWPDQPEPVSAANDAEDEIRRSIARDSDAMLILGCRVDQLAEDMRVVGYYRRNAIEADKRGQLPCAVLDRIGQDGGDRRLKNARKYRLDWIDATNENWPQAVRDWLAGEAERMKG